MDILRGLLHALWSLALGVWLALKRCWSQDASPRSGPSPTPEHVIVVGAGFAGLAIIRSLAKSRDLRVTLVDPKDYVEYTPGVLRAFLREGAAAAVEVSLQSCVPASVRFVRGRCARVEEPGADHAVAVVLSDGTVLGGDRCVLATGAEYDGAIKASQDTMTERTTELIAESQAAATAGAVCVVGGGPVGVELAAELACRKQGPAVTLVTRGPRLLTSLPPAAHTHAAHWLRQQGVDVHCGLTAAGPHRDGHLPLSDGQRVPCSRVYTCIGPRASHGPIAASRTLSAAATSRGVTVSDALVVHGSRDRVFSAGDVAMRGPSGAAAGSGGGDDKMAAVAEAHAHIVARNIERARSGEDLCLFPQAAFGVPTVPRLMCLSLGPWHGVLIFNSLVLGGPLGGRFAALVKHVIEVTKILEMKGSRASAALWHGIEWANSLVHQHVIPPCTPA